MENNFSLPAPPAEAHYTVYKLTDPEGKIYIGCTGQPVENRWRRGKCYRHQASIRDAIERFGWDAFQKEILCEKLTRAGGDKLEKWFIAYYDSSNPEKGHNRFLGGLGKGSRVSEDAKLLYSEVSKKMYAEHPEVIDKIRESVEQLYATDPAYRQRVSEGVLKAYEKNPELKAHISATVKERWNNPEYKARVSSTHINSSVCNFEMSKKKRTLLMNYYKAHPEAREAARRRKKAQIAKSGGLAFPNTDSRPKPVLCVETGVIYPSQCAAERAIGYAGVHNVCRGRKVTCGGYHWRYV